MTTKAQADAATRLVHAQPLPATAREQLLQALGLAPYWGADVQHRTATAKPALRVPDHDEDEPTQPQARALPRVIRTTAVTGRRIA